jgi:hypothetical protein
MKHWENQLARLRTAEEMLRGVPIFALSGLAFIGCIGLAGQIIAGTFLRPIGDDYSLLYKFHDSTQPWLSNTFSYLGNTNGRYAQNISLSILYGSLGHKLLMITSGMAILCMAVAFYYLIPVFLKDLQQRSNLLLRLAASLLLTFALSFVVFESPFSTSASFQYIYWAPGVITYTVPLALLLLLVSWIFIKQAGKSTFACLLGGFAVGLFNEVFCLLFFTVLTIGYLLYVSDRHSFILQKKYQSLFHNLLAIGGGLVAATMVILLSPAARHRQTGAGPLSIATALHNTITNAHNIIMSTLQIQKPLLLAPFMGGVLVALVMYRSAAGRYLSSQKLITYGALLAWLAALFSLLVAAFTVAVSYRGVALPFRMVILYNVWFVLAVFLTGFTIGGWMSARLPIVSRSAISLVLLGGVFWLMPTTMHQVTSQLHTNLAFASAWEIQHDATTTQALAGEQVIHEKIVTLGDNYPTPCLNNKTSGWYTRDVSNYYHVKLICP